VPSDFVFKSANRVHRAIQVASFGRLGWTGAKMPVLELTTIGRKSGKPRTVMLTSPIRDGESIVVVASRGGDDRAPDWYLNLVENQLVRVSERGRKSEPMTARTATTDEKARLWPEIVAKYSNYAEYQGKTDREIPLVLLDLA
jgi:deazaflavin-dependent oxidoreductase (nitroreductase family)